MDTFTLRIFVMGLVALVPRYDGYENSVAIVLPSTVHEAGHKHVPILVFPCANDVKECKTPFDAKAIAAETVADNLNNHRLFYDDAYFDGFLLHGDELRFSGVVTPVPPPKPPKYFFTRANKNHLTDIFELMPETGQEAGDFSWLPSLAMLSPGYGVLKESILKPHGEDEVSALARFSEIGGSVRSFDLSNLGGRVKCIKFKGSGTYGKTSRRAASDIAVIEVNVRSPLTISVCGFADGRCRRSVTLKPAENLSAVEILIGNLSPMLQRKEAKTQGKESLYLEDDRTTLTHFNLYYNLCTDKPANPVAPRLGCLFERNADEINPRPSALPPVIKVVSLVPEDSTLLGVVGGPSRAICTLAVIDPP